MSCAAYSVRELRVLRAVRAARAVRVARVLRVVRAVVPRLARSLVGLLLAGAFIALAAMTPVGAAAADGTAVGPAGSCVPSGGAPGGAPFSRLPAGGAIGPGIGGSGIDEFVALFDGARPRAAPTSCDAPVPAALRTQVADGEPASLVADGVGRSAGNPVDVVTGNKYHRQIDAVLPHAQSSALSSDGLASAFGLPQDDSSNLQFARHYNSRSDFALSLGRGWSHSFDTRLARIARGNRIELQIVQADGRRLVFRAVQRTPGGAGAFAARRYATGRIADGLIDQVVPRASVADGSAANGSAADATASDSSAAFTWRWPGGRRVHFDAHGRLSSIVSADGDTIRLRRDETGRLVEAADNAGRALGFEYAHTRLSALHLPDGQRVRYEYDAHGQLVAVRFPDGRSQRYHYEDPRAFHLLTGITDTDGRRSRYRYDDGLRISESRAIGDDESRGMHFDWELPKRAGAPGRTTVRVGARVSRFRWVDAHNGAEPVLLESTGDGCVRCPPMGLRSQVDAHGRVLAIGAMRIRRDAAGRVVARNVADARGRTQWIERRSYADADPLSPPTRIEVPSVVPGRSAQLDLRYNERAQVVAMSFSGFAPDGESVASIGASLRLEYVRSGPAEGRLREIVRVSPDGLQRTTFGYDAQRRLVSMMHGALVRHDIERDAMGRAVVERLPDGRTRRRSWDGNWRLAQTGAGGSRVALEYDGAGRPRSLSWSSGERWSIVLAAGGVEIASNRGWRQRFAVSDDATDAAGTNAPANHATKGAAKDTPMGTPKDTPKGEPKGEPKGASGVALAVVRTGRGGQQLVDAAGRRTQWRRDDLGRLVEFVSAHEGTRRYRYDAFGRLARIEYADGSVDSRAYDGSGRTVRREQVFAGERVETKFGYRGTQLFSVEHPQQRSFGRYDDEGRLVELVHERAGRLYQRGFTYDDRGLLTEQRLPDGSRMVQRHDAEGAPESLELVGANSASARAVVRRVATDAPTQSTLQLGNGLRYEQRDDASGHPVSMRWLPAPTAGRTGASALVSRRLQWSPAGLPTSITHERGEDRFGHDRFGRLIVRERHVGEGVERRLEHVEYFALGLFGERIGARLRDGSDRTVPAQARDAGGRPLAVGNRKLRYGAQRRLVEVDDEAFTATYRYDAFGQRLLKSSSPKTAGSPHGPQEPGQANPPTVETRGFLHHDHRLVGETAADGRLLRQYLYWDGRPVAVLDHGAQRDSLTWLHSDHLGTPIAASDESGRVVWRADYDAYGRLADEQGAFAQPLRRAGQYFDAETGLHDNLLRTYDPDAGAYLEPDPVGLAAGFDPYVYADASPLVATDPLGLILFAFDGTGNGATGRNGEDISNVRKFFEAYEDPDKWYMAGVGRDDSASGIAATSLDWVDGGTARERVDWMVGVLDGFLGDAWVGKVAPIDVVGFSRGAAMARDFVNRISAMVDAGRFRERGVCVDLRFLGLWDTVAQFGWLGVTNDRWKLAIPSAVRATFHAVALNEHRSLFPLESAAGSGAWVLERGFIGDHADVGGGNAESDLSDVSLVWITTMARSLGVPVREPSYADRHVGDPRVHDRDYLRRGDRDVYRRDAGGRIVRDSALRRTAIGGMSWRETSRFLVPYARRGIDAAGQPSIVARVDIDAYAAWLKESYGIDLLN